MSATATIADVLEGRARWCVVNEDCLEAMATLPDRSVAHVISDPPYSKTVVTSAMGAPPGVIGKQQTRDLSYKGIADDARRLVALEMARVAQRWLLVFCDAESLHLWRDNLEAGGAQHIRMGAWVMSNPTPQFTGDRPGTGWEACEIAHRPGRKRWNGGGLPAVWRHDRPHNGSLERASLGHPTPKPLPLMLEIIEQFTDPDDLVLDPFNGSGTTGAACVRLGRRYIGIDLCRVFCENARDRLEAESKGLTLRDYRAGQMSLLG